MGVDQFNNAPYMLYINGSIFLRYYNSYICSEANNAGCRTSTSRYVLVAGVYSTSTSKNYFNTTNRFHDLLFKEKSERIQDLLSIPQLFKYVVVVVFFFFFFCGLDCVAGTPDVTTSCSTNPRRSDGVRWSEWELEPLR